MDNPSSKIIITARIWQLIIATIFVVMATLVRYYPFNCREGLWLWGVVFTVVFSSSYMREERRATKSPDSNCVLNWNLIESFLLLASLVGFFIFTFVHRWHEIFFYAYFHTGTIGLLSGIAVGEFIWQNIRLRELDEECRARYWANYKDSIW